MHAPLAARLAALRAAEPGLYPRDQAARLGISECELLAMSEGRGATRLQPGFAPLLAALHRLGPVSALTRNDHAVHEKIGTYGKPEGGGHVTLFLGEAIDLRIFLGSWAHGWAVQAPAGRRSLQFFGRDGGAFHKIFATEDTDLEAWTALVAGQTATTPPVPIEPPATPAPPRPDSEVDVPAFLSGWDALRDVHDLLGLLRKHGLTRSQGLRLAGPVRARPVKAGSLRLALTRAARTGLPIMVFVTNPGCIQVHAGPVRTLFETGPWFHVDDPGFKLHLREPAIQSAWVVTKPSDDGPVTSLELFDAGGAPIASLFGGQKPGQAEDPAWRALLGTLPGG